MALWNIDLTTQDGIRSASEMGGFACYVSAGLTAVSTLFLLAFRGYGDEGIAAADVILFAMVPALLVYLIAGWRLRSGKGVFWGSAAILITGLFLLFGLVSLSIPSIFINAIVLVTVINGVRGALAARRSLPADTAEVFE